MYKLNQKQLLEKNFWDSFKPALSQGWKLGKAVAKVAAPEIAGPAKAIRDWFKQTKTDVKRAGMTIKDIVLETLQDANHIPYEGAEGQINWKKNKLTGKLEKNSKGFFTGSVKVGRLGYDENGEAIMVAEYTNPNKRLAFFTFDPSTKDVKIITHPYQNLNINPLVQNKNQNQNQNQNQTTPQQNQAPQQRP
jgi:hypothetical protein